MGKETLSNYCCGNLGESSCEVEKWSDRGTPDTQKLPFYFIVLINGN
jgi:hypothetical protein